MVAVPVRSKRALALVVCLLVAASGVVSAAAVAAVPEGEPNDTPADATPVESGVAVTGTVDDLYNLYTNWYDQDYFVIRAVGRAEISVDLSRSGGSGILYVAIGTLDDVPMTEFVPVAPGETRTVRTTVPTTGLYLVYVTGYSGYEFSPGIGSYVLTARTDGTEPDSSGVPTPVWSPPATATPTDVPDPTPRPGQSDSTPATTATAEPTPPPDDGGNEGGNGGSEPVVPPSPNAAALVAVGFAGFLLGFLTGNAESEGTKKQALGLFAAVFGGGGLVSLVQQSPGLGWLVVAGVVGVVTGLLVGTLFRNRGVTFAPHGA